MRLMTAKFIIPIILCLLGISLRIISPALGQSTPQVGPGMPGARMGHMHMMNACPHMGNLMMGPMSMMSWEGEIKVNNIKNGVTLTVTSSDPNEVRRIQKRYEIIKLIHELNEMNE